MEHLLGILRDNKHFSKGQQQAVNSAVMRWPPFPGGLRLPSEGINTMFKHAQQQGALAKVMPPALLALPDHPWARVLASVFCGELAMSRVPTPAGLQWNVAKAAHACCGVQVIDNQTAFISVSSELLICFPCNLQSTWSLWL